MFDKDVLDEARELEAKWSERAARVYKGKEFKARTGSGIPVKPVYNPTDIADLDFKDIGVPGEYPFTRGIYPIQYQFQPWMNRPVMGYGLPEQTRERMDLLAREGMRGYFETPSYNVVFDLPSKAGLDPDDPRAQGFVGQAGVTTCNLEDMDRLFHDIPLDRTNIVHNMGSATLVELGMFIVYAEGRGYARDQLRGNSMNWLYKAPFVDYAMFPPKGAFTLMVELIKFCSHHMPQWNTTNISGRFVEEAGGNAIQQIAFNVATRIAVTEACMKVGLHADQILPRISSGWAQSDDFFEEIAKTRAFRRLWAKIARERFGCVDPRSMHVRMHTHTTGISLTAQQPLVNIVRAAIHTLGAVLSGTNSIATCAYDEALSIPTEEAATLALRTQQVVLNETNVANVSDPLAGSYYVEWLTSRLEGEAAKMVEEIDRRGYVNCWESGWFKQEVENEAYRWREMVDSGEKVMVGLNRFKADEEIKIPVFRLDPAIEEIAVQRVREFRARRDNAGVQEALAAMREAALRVQEGDGDLMPAVLDAARANATIGEMQGVLKEVFGWGYSS